MAKDPNNPFGPGQATNQFSLYNNAAFPWPSSYAGWPTDAMGNPIVPPDGMTIPPAGTTINSNPAAPPAPAPAADPRATGNFMMNYPISGQSIPNPNMLGGRGGGQPAPAPAAPPAATGGPTYQQILTMLGNPGKVTTPGANVPIAASSGQPSPGALQAFLANWKPASSGPGSGFQQAFANTLKGL
jgi:hypothetical protein